MSENAHLRQIRRLVNIIDDRVHHAYYSGDVDSKWANTDDIIDHAEAMARDLAEAEAQRDILRTHSEGMVPLYNDLERRLAEAEARVGRWKRMALAHDAYEDVLLYPTATDGTDQEQARAELFAAHADLKAHGDLPDAAAKGEA